MKTCIQMRGTRYFLGQNGEWTSREEARIFNTIVEAFDFATAQKLEDVEIVKEFELPGEEVRLPVRPTRSSEPRVRERTQSVG